MPYDDAEAKDLLSKFTANDLSNNRARVDAARRLLDDLAKLTAPGMRIDKDKDEEGSVTMNFRGRRVCIVVHPDDGRIMQAKVGGSLPLGWQEVPGLRLDVLANPPELVGEKADEFRVPVPGQPRQRRSALAVVVEAALKAMHTDDR